MVKTRHACSFARMMNTKRIIGKWLLLGVALLMVQVFLGGVTRLTGSGLSITEWKPLLGALPPMNETEWQIVFDQYKQIAQFKYLNQDFSLSDFKWIYFWEWLHRNWARLISIVFLLPFGYFLFKKMITREMVPPLIGLFVLGLAQGLIGWIMVASGLNNENLYVSHIRLAIHFISAMVLIAFTYWFALSLLVKPEDRVYHPKLRRFSLVLIVLLVVQLGYGAFMAGLKAATVAPTWPDINGDILPANWLSLHYVNHPIAIHIIHRMLAYLLLTLSAIWTYKMYAIPANTYFAKYRLIPMLFIVLQVILGIVTVINAQHLTRNGMGIFENLALLHQLCGMCLAMSFVWALYVLSPKSEN